MNLIPLIILFCIAFALQYLLTFLQMKSFMGSYRSLRQKGRVAIGKAKGAFRAGAIAMFAIDGDGRILEGSCLQGVTVFARARALKGFEGMDVGTICQEDCKRMHLPGPITKAVLEASSNYRILMVGGELKEEPAPLAKAANALKRLAVRHAEA